jgi:hypothetical protein
MNRQDYFLHIEPIYQNRIWFWTAKIEREGWYENVEFDVPNRSSFTSKKIDSKWAIENKFEILNQYSVGGSRIWKFLKETQEKFRAQEIIHVYDLHVLEGIKEILRKYGTLYSSLASNEYANPLDYPLNARAVIDEAIAINSWLNTYNCEYKGYEMNSRIQEKQAYVWKMLRFDLTNEAPTNEGFLTNILGFYMTRHRIVTFPSFQNVKEKGKEKRMIKQTQIIHTVADLVWTLMSLMLMKKSETMICNFRRCKSQYFISKHDRQIFCNIRCQKAEQKARSRDNKMKKK